MLVVEGVRLNLVVSAGVRHCRFLILLGAVMILSDEERAQLPRELFALAGRRFEYGTIKAMEGEGRGAMSHGALSARLHELGQDLRVIPTPLPPLQK